MSVSENFPLRPWNFETVKVNSRGEIVKHETKQAKCFSIDLGNDIDLEMVKIPGGSFVMGSPVDEIDRARDEIQYRVNVRGFYLGKYQITQAQWQAIVGNNPSKFKKEGKYPVERVSWYDSQDFCRRLSQQTGLSFRLPTETQWEYACRAGTKTPFYFGETLNIEIANYNGNYTYGFGKIETDRGEPTAVGSFPANAFGLYDLHGNLWEWCEDDDGCNNSSTPRDRVELENPGKVIRGGSWFDDPASCRCASRLSYHPSLSNHCVGFRVVLAAKG